MKRVHHPPVQQDKDVSDEESQAKNNVPQPDLSSNTHVPSRLPATDRHKYQKKVAMARETLAANTTKQSGEDTTADTTANEARSSAAFAEQGK